MADGYHAIPPPPRRSPQEDHDWLARLASQEHTSVEVQVNRAVRHFRGWETTGRRAVAEAVGIIDWACGEYEAQLARERGIRRAYERRLQHERRLRRGYEERLRRQRRRYERQPRTEPDGHRDAPYSPRVAKLLALAIRCESDSEATAAFAKARALHR